MNVRAPVPLLLLAAVLAACSKKSEETAGKPVPVRIVAVNEESIARYIRATGSIAGEQDVVLFSKMSERVEKVHVSPGQAVAKDLVLVEQKNEMQKQGVEIASAALKTAEAQAALSAAEYRRMSRLYAEKAISPQQYDQAKLAKEAADHALEQARSVQQQAREQFENSLARAPFDGVTAAVYVDENQMVAAGQPVVQVLSPSRMKAEVYLTGEDIHQVKAGQPVVVRFPALPGEEFAGRVADINTAIDRNSRTFEVEIALLAGGRRLKSGMFGEFLIETERHPRSVVVPEAGLLSQTEMQIDRKTGLQKTVKKLYLYLVRQGTARMQEVTTGIANNGRIEILRGVNAGDSVIVVGQNIVKEGRAVTVVE